MQGIYTYIPETNYVPREYILLILHIIIIIIIAMLLSLFIPWKPVFIAVQKSNPRAWITAGE